MIQRPRRDSPSAQSVHRGAQPVPSACREPKNSNSKGTEIPQNAAVSQGGPSTRCLPACALPVRMRGLGHRDVWDFTSSDDEMPNDTDDEAVAPPENLAAAATGFAGVGIAVQVVPTATGGDGSGDATGGTLTADEPCGCFLVECVVTRSRGEAGPAMQVLSTDAPLVATPVVHAAAGGDGSGDAAGITLTAVVDGDSGAAAALEGSVEPAMSDLHPCPLFCPAQKLKSKWRSSTRIATGRTTRMITLVFTMIATRTTTMFGSRRCSSPASTGSYSIRRSGRRILRPWSASGS